MPFDTKPDEVKQEVVQLKEIENRYSELANSELRAEYNEMKDEYKAARKKARTVSEKKIIMSSYLSDVQDIAAEAVSMKDWELVSELNGIIDSLRTRTTSGFKNRGY